MPLGSIRKIVLGVLIALVANVNCFAQCALQDCSLNRSQPGSCHHQKPSQPESPSCSHQDSEFATQGASEARLDLADFAGFVALPNPAAASLSLQLFSSFDTGPPPSQPAGYPSSVLRI